MARFRFRMNTLLKLHEATRDERRTELAMAQRAADAVQERLDELGQELATLGAASRQAISPGRIDVDHLLTVQRYELLLRAQEQQTQAQKQMVDAEVERRREAVVAANREVKSLENLRTKLLDKHQADEAKRELAALDEVAGRLHDREVEAR